MDEIRKEIANMEKSAERLKSLAEGNNAIRKNADIILTFLYILKFITPTVEELDSRQYVCGRGPLCVLSFSDRIG